MLTLQCAQPCGRGTTIVQLERMWFCCAEEARSCTIENPATYLGDGCRILMQNGKC